MTEQEIQQLFENEILADLTVEEVVDKYDSMQETTIKKQLRLKYCDWLISVVSKNYLK